MLYLLKMNSINHIWPLQSYVRCVLGMHYLYLFHWYFSFSSLFVGHQIFAWCFWILFKTFHFISSPITRAPTQPVRSALGDSSVGSPIYFATWQLIGFNWFNIICSPLIFQGQSNWVMSFLIISSIFIAKGSTLVRSEIGFADICIYFYYTGCRVLNGPIEQ